MCIKRTPWTSQGLSVIWQLLNGGEHIVLYCLHSSLSLQRMQRSKEWSWQKTKQTWKTTTCYLETQSWYLLRVGGKMPGLEPTRTRSLEWFDTECGSSSGVIVTLIVLSSLPFQTHYCTNSQVFFFKCPPSVTCGWNFRFICFFIFSPNYLFKRWVKFTWVILSLKYILCFLRVCHTQKRHDIIFSYLWMSMHTHTHYYENIKMCIQMCIRYIHPIPIRHDKLSNISLWPLWSRQY